MTQETDKIQKPRTEYFCAYPKGSKNPSRKKIETYCTRIGCPHLVNLATNITPPKD